MQKSEAIRTQFEKAKDRLRNKPTDYTYDEAKGLLAKLGFIENNKGKTSGSRIAFIRLSDKKTILLHKPHPGNIMKEYMVKDLINFLKDLGEL